MPRSRDAQRYGWVPQKYVPSSVPFLSREIIDKVLQHVGRRDLLISCAVVNQMWHAASKAALTSITLKDLMPATGDFLVGWLQRHGQHITSLSVCGRSDATSFVHIPCTGLRQLHLEHCSVQVGLDRAAHHPGVLQGKPHLTKVVLRQCVVLEGPTSTAALSAVTCLKHLVLADLETPTSPIRNLQVVGSTLSTLTALTSLTLAGAVGNRALSHLSTLSNLQELQLSGCQQLRAEGLAGCSSLQQLTKFTLSNAPLLFIDPDNTPTFGSMTSLKCLQLESGVYINPAVLDTMTALQQLVLCKARMGLVGSVGALLHVLPKMQALQHLDLQGSLGTLAVGHTADAYTTLVSGGSLTHLNLQDCVIPWQGLFGSAGHASRLQSLLLGTKLQPSMDATDVARLALRCSHVTMLDLSGCVLNNANLGLLCAMRHLRSLTATIANEQAAAAVAKVSCLQELIVKGPGPLSNIVLLPLAHLRGLTRLEVFHDDGLGEPGAQVVLEGQAGDHVKARASVWWAILQRCHNAATACVTLPEGLVQHLIIAYKEAEQWAAGEFKRLGGGSSNGSNLLPAHGVLVLNTGAMAMLQLQLDLKEIWLNLQEALLSQAAANQVLSTHNLSWRQAQLRSAEAMAAELSLETQAKMDKLQALADRGAEVSIGLHAEVAKVAKLDAEIAKQDGIIKGLETQVTQLQRHLSRANREAQDQKAAHNNMMNTMNSLRTKNTHLQDANLRLQAQAQHSYAIGMQDLSYLAQVQAHVMQQQQRGLQHYH